LVPSIATEYTRHRAEHDARARQWTELYALPPPPPPPPKVISPTKQSAAKGKGKAKQDMIPINIDLNLESSDEGSSGSLTQQLRAQVRRTDSRTASHPGNKRKRSGQPAGETIVIESDSSDEESARAARRSRPNRAASGRSENGGKEVRNTAAERRRAPISSEIIEISDSD
jgi:hypothetical protein